MSTHYIEEAERLADTVAIMSAGRIVARGAPSELVRAHAGHEVVEVYGPPAHLRELEAVAERAGRPTRRTGTGLAYLRAEEPGTIGEADGRGDGPSEGERRPANLEDAFVAVTGQEIA
jgi:lipooligosaccharide transport system ATP-binding protein